MIKGQDNWSKKATTDTNTKEVYEFDRNNGQITLDLLF